MYYSYYSCRYLHNMNDMAITEFTLIQIFTQEIVWIVMTTKFSPRIAVANAKWKVRKYQEIFLFSKKVVELKKHIIILIRGLFNITNCFQFFDSTTLLKAEAEIGKHFRWHFGRFQVKKKNLRFLTLKFKEICNIFLTNHFI